MGLFDGLIQPNSAVRVEALSTDEDAADFTREAYRTVVAAGVPCLVSLTKGGRDGRFSDDVNLDQGTLTGDDPSLNRQDVRLYFEDGPAAGQYARVLDVTVHRASPDGWIPERYTLTWQVWQPAS